MRGCEFVWKLQKTCIIWILSKFSFSVWNLGLGHYFLIFFVFGGLGQWFVHRRVGSLTSIIWRNQKSPQKCSKKGKQRNLWKSQQFFKKKYFWRFFLGFAHLHFSGPIFHLFRGGAWRWPIRCRRDGSKSPPRAFGVVKLRKIELCWPLWFFSCFATKILVIFDVFPTKGHNSAIVARSPPKGP